MSTAPAPTVVRQGAFRTALLLVAFSGSALLLARCATLAPDSAGAQRVTETFRTAIADGDGRTVGDPHHETGT
jgi:hypothetical protein